MSATQFPFPVVKDARRGGAQLFREGSTLRSLPLELDRITSLGLQVIEKYYELLFDPPRKKQCAWAVDLHGDVIPSDLDGPSAQLACFLSLLAEDVSIKTAIGQHQIWCTGGLAGRYEVDKVDTETFVEKVKTVQELGGRLLIAPAENCDIADSELDKLGFKVASPTEAATLLKAQRRSKTRRRGRTKDQFMLVSVREGPHGLPELLEALFSSTSLANLVRIQQGRQSDSDLESEIAADLELPPKLFSRRNWRLSLLAVIGAAISAAILVLVLARHEITPLIAFLNSPTNPAASPCARATALLGTDSVDHISEALKVLEGERDMQRRVQCASGILLSEHPDLLQTVFATAAIAKEQVGSEFFRTAAHQLMRNMREFLALQSLTTNSADSAYDSEALLTGLDAILAEMPDPRVLLRSTREDIPACDGGWEHLRELLGLGSRTTVHAGDAAASDSLLVNVPGGMSRLILNQWFSACAGTSRIWLPIVHNADEPCGPNGRCFTRPSYLGSLKEECICREIGLENACWSFGFSSKGSVTEYPGRFGELFLHSACKWPTRSFLLWNGPLDDLTSIRGVYLLGDDAPSLPGHPASGRNAVFFPLLSDDMSGGGRMGDVLIPIGEKSGSLVGKRLVVVSSASFFEKKYHFDLCGQGLVDGGQLFTLWHIDSTGAKLTGRGTTIFSNEDDAWALSVDCDGNKIASSAVSDVALAFSNQRFPRFCGSKLIGSFEHCLRDSLADLREILRCTRAAPDDAMADGYREAFNGALTAICDSKDGRRQCEALTGESPGKHKKDNTKNGKGSDVGLK